MLLHKAKLTCSVILAHVCTNGRDSFVKRGQELMFGGGTTLVVFPHLT